MKVAHVVLGRALGFQVAEAACCFILAKSTENPEKRKLAMQREQRAILEAYAQAVVAAEREGWSEAVCRACHLIASKRIVLPNHYRAVSVDEARM